MLPTKEQPQGPETALNRAWETSVLPPVNTTRAVHEPGPTRETSTVRPRNVAVQGLSALALKTLAASPWTLMMASARELDEQLKQPSDGQ